MTKHLYWFAIAALTTLALVFVLIRWLSVIVFDDVVVPLPIGSAVARIQGGYAIVVETPHGRIRHEMWEDWGPAVRTSLYVTPEDWIVALGGGGSSTMIAIKANAAPILVDNREQQRTRSETWRYIGAVDLEKRRLRFFSPSEQAECFAMFGEGSSPYRKEHQVEHFCPDP